MAVDPVLRFTAPAGTWVEALPLGDGRLGAMCWGTADGERLSLNDDRAWSGPAGGPVHEVPDGHAAAVERARAAALAGDHRLAEDLLRPVVVPHTQAYLPLGDLRVTCDPLPVSRFERGLDMRAGTAWVRREHPHGCSVRQETLVSAPAGVLLHRLRATGTAVDVTVSLTSPLRVRSGAASGAGEGGAELEAVLELPVDVRPWSPDGHDEPVTRAADGEAARCAAVVLRVRTDGTVLPAGPGAAVRVLGARTLDVLLATEVSDTPGGPCTGEREAARTARARVAAAAATGSGELVRAHRADLSPWWDAAHLDLGAAVPAGTSTGELLRRAVDDDGSRRALVELVVAHARYLLLAGSRPGTHPLTLQGIWNAELQPPWSSNYTTNINLQMAYWPVEVWGLAPLHEPLLTFVRRLAAAGEDTARRAYGAGGWVAHHNSDVWATTGTAGGGWADPSWSAWPYGGAWLATHLHEHARFAADPPAAAREALPVVAGAARFVLDRLVRLPDGELGTAPSTSPENRFLDREGEPRAAAVSSTCDLALTAAVLRALLDLTATAGTAGDGTGDEELLRRASAALAELPAPRTGARGELLEWREELPEAEPGHRHTSHLVGLFPLDLVDPAGPLAVAAARTLQLRGEESTGWALAWRACLWARLGRGDRVGETLRRCLRPVPEDAAAGAQAGGLYPNLFSAHPPFQLDGNSGLAAAVAEALVQSGDTDVRVLPALPPDWPDGSVRGLRTRAGVQVELTWRAGRPERVVLTALRDAHGTVHAGPPGGTTLLGEFRLAAGERTEVPPTPFPTPNTEEQT
ncbi:glycosyl hydrolase family 95 catalytic domain-containing protein [Kineococcus sp. SYSU DK018]|uniref:glycosyl hydrolase family 95 catalytic domain-containing protein n=1 Tax=Kineococcus sp. SYSU DK018 TaxID=3383139 RepID=UPI003D7D16E1